MVTSGGVSLTLYLVRQMDQLPDFESTSFSVMRRAAGYGLGTRTRSAGEWEPVVIRVFNARGVLELEWLSTPVGVDEVRVRSDRAPPRVAIVEAALHLDTEEALYSEYQIKSDSWSKLMLLYAKVMERVMRTRAVAVAHAGWLLKEEADLAGSCILKHDWFVLFSNGYLFHFSSPKEATLDQSLGAVPVQKVRGMYFEYARQLRASASTRRGTSATFS
eukprot:6308914-Prymnesium_polylepis.1